MSEMETPTPEPESPAEDETPAETDTPEESAGDTEDN